MTAMLLAMMLIVTLGPDTTGQTLLSKKMQGVPEVFLTSPTLMNVTFFSRTFGHWSCSAEALELTVRKCGGKPVEYIKVKMETVCITNVTTGGSGAEDRLTENVTLNFAKVSVDYTPQKADGSADTAIPFGWDIAANSKE
jgi:type VI protein secretion system component Hcp